LGYTWNPVLQSGIVVLRHLWRCTIEARRRAAGGVMKSFRSIVVVMCMLAVAGSAVAQSRGSARVSGKVVDEQGQPLQDVQVRAVRAGEQQPLMTKTNKKGEWSINGLASGDWTVDFFKEGLAPLTVPAKVVEGEPVPPLSVTLGKPVDPNVEIQAQAQKAADLFEKKQFAESRKIYDDLLAKYPTVHQLHAMIARTYAGEENFPKAIEEMRVAVEKDPTNVETKLLLGELLLEKGDKEEGRKLIEGTDLAQVKDPFPFINVAITLINSSKPDEALALMDKVVARFPDQADVYYYRGRANVAAQKLDAAKTDLEKYVSMAPADAKEVADAKKILEQLNKK
jgi:Flp pilus assembly protein TadD